MNYEIIVDGNTLVNHWYYIRELENVNIYLSASNFILAKLTVLANKRSVWFQFNKKKKQEFLQNFAPIDKILLDYELNKEVDDFISQEINQYMRPLIIDSDKNIKITVFKGYVLDKGPGVKITPILEEPVAYALHRKLEGNEIELFTNFSQLVDFTSTYDFGLNIKSFPYE